MATKFERTTAARIMGQLGGKTMTAKKHAALCENLKKAREGKARKALERAANIGQDVCAK